MLTRGSRDHSGLPKSLCQDVESAVLMYHAQPSEFGAFWGENGSCTTAMFFQGSFVVKMRNLATDQIFAQVNIKIQHAMSLHLSL